MREKENYTAPVAEATRSKIMMNVLQTLSGGATFDGWYGGGVWVHPEYEPPTSIEL